MADEDHRLPAIPARPAISHTHRVSVYPLASKVVTGAGLMATALLVVLAYRAFGEGGDPLDRITLVTLGVLASALIVAKLVIRSGVLFLLLYALHAVVLAFLLLLLRSAGTAYEVLVVVFLVEGALFAPSGLGLPLSAGAALVLWIAPLALGGFSDPILESMPRALLYVCVACVASGLIHYREQLVVATGDLERLDNAVTQLTRTSMSYQEYAQNAAERSQEEERQRITRDIHDIVGYTLTNNIMMMEAATDMIRRNPLGVTSLIDAARENAQEGLEQIRSSLYRLRSQEISPPSGLTAIDRLVRIFQKATGIEVTIDYSDTPLTISPTVDSILYHYVQEGLINSFRHGRATKIDVTSSRVSGDLVVVVRDNGKGTSSTSEGIGIRGMRERAGKVGGTVDYWSDATGFTIRLTLPLEPKERQP